MIFSQEGRTALLELDSADQYRKNLSCPRVVLFLVLNCLMHVSPAIKMMYITVAVCIIQDSYAVKSAAKDCVIEVLNYIAKLQGRISCNNAVEFILMYFQARCYWITG